MKTLIAVLLALGAAVLGGIIVHTDPGQVIIAYDVWAIETSLAALFAVLVLGFVALYIALRILSRIFSVPKALGKHNEKRRHNKTLRGIANGFVSLAEGQWDKAEKVLSKNGSSDLIGLLGAARAAHKLGESQRRDRYLKRAVQLSPGADIAVSLTQTDMQLDSKEFKLAKANIDRLVSLEPRHPYVMRLASKLYLSTRDWPALNDMLPRLQKQELLDADRLAALETQTWVGMLTDCDYADLEARWNQLPKKARYLEPVIERYAARLAEQEKHAEAEQMVRAALDSSWNDNLAHLYGNIKHADPAQQLDFAERWYSNHGTSAKLLLTLGKLSERRQIWGKARSYYEKSLEQENSAEGALCLGRLLRQLGEEDAASELYRQGLEISIGDISHTQSIDEQAALLMPNKSPAEAAVS